jgi:hypothetical protein
LIIPLKWYDLHLRWSNVLCRWSNNTLVEDNGNRCAKKKNEEGQLDER